MSPVLSKYERVQIVASRVEQLLAGAPRMIDDDDTDDVVEIAEREIGRRLLPVRVARRLPNGKVRIHDLREFIDPTSEYGLGRVADEGRASASPPPRPDGPKTASEESRDGEAPELAPAGRTSEGRTSEGRTIEGRTREGRTREGRARTQHAPSEPEKAQSVTRAANEARAP